MSDLPSPTSSRLGSSSSRNWPGRVAAGVRILLGLLFIAAGVPKFTAHATWVSQFEHWQVPLPGLSVYAVGGLEVFGGILLALGVGSTLLATLFVIDMIGALLFAGTRDGLAYIIPPLVYGIPSLLFAIFGGGAWQLRPLPPLRRLLTPA